ncbi:MAG: alpha/beta hydrolase [Chloroflexi bacterium]|nr:alpha/beta hydrolase [Chloroflexota bacterium]
MLEQKVDYGLPLIEAARRAGVTIVDESEPEDKYVDVDGLRMHYLDWGTAGKQPMLLLHGGRLSAHTWDFFALAMRKAHHVIALDQLGHGDSAWAPDGDYSREAHVRVIARCVDRLGLENFVLCGHSMGGQNAMAYAASHPEKLSALVIVDTGPEHMQAGSERIFGFHAQVSELDSFDAFVEQALKFNSRRDPLLMRGGMRYLVRQLPNGKWAWKYDRNIIRDWHQLTPEEEASLTAKLWATVEAVRCPTLIIRGADTENFPKETGPKMAQIIPGGRFVEVPKAGHTVMADNPPDFERAVWDFFKSLRSS